MIVVRPFVKRFSGELGSLIATNSATIVPKFRAKNKRSSVAAEIGERVAVDVFDLGQGTKAGSFERVIVVGGNECVGKRATLVVDTVDYLKPCVV